MSAEPVVGLQGQARRLVASLASAPWAEHLAELRGAEEALRTGPKESPRPAAFIEGGSIEPRTAARSPWSLSLKSGPGLPRVCLRCTEEFPSWWVKQQPILKQSNQETRPFVTAHNSRGPGSTKSSQRQPSSVPAHQVDSGTPLPEVFKHAQRKTA